MGLWDSATERRRHGGREVAALTGHRVSVWGDEQFWSGWWRRSHDDADVRETTELYV